MRLDGGGGGGVKKLGEMNWTGDEQDVAGGGSRKNNRGEAEASNHVSDPADFGSGSNLIEHTG